MDLSLHPPASFWQLLGLCLLGYAGLWWWLIGARRWSRLRALRRRLSALGPANTASEFAALGALQQALVRRRRPPGGVGRDRAGELHYRIPWFLFIGDANGGVNALLRTACAVDPGHARGTPPPADDAFLHWWQLGAMTAVEIGPDAVCGPDALRQRSQWYQALLQLVEQRERLPLNGLVVCLGATTLLDDEHERHAVAQSLRRLMHETTDALRLRLPIYLLVTGLEQLPGYATVRTMLSPEVQAQALGHRLAAPLRFGVVDSGVPALLDPLFLRLEALGLALLRAQSDPADRLAVYRFFEGLRALRPGLQAVAESLFDPGTAARAPRWRGVYLTAAQVDDADGGVPGAFVADLFEHFLAVDQPLANE